MFLPLVTSVIRDGNVVKFSKALDFRVKVTASYFGYGEFVIITARISIVCLIDSIILN